MCYYNVFLGLLWVMVTHQKVPRLGICTLCLGRKSGIDPVPVQSTVVHPDETIIEKKERLSISFRHFNVELFILKLCPKIYLIVVKKNSEL